MKGWYTPNHVAPRCIVPEWRAAGGGVAQSEITTKSEALRTAIGYLHNRKDTCNDMIRRFQAELAKLT